VKVTAVEGSIGAQESLRERILSQYVSSNAGPHRPMGEMRLRAYRTAYRYHLRGWMPEPVDGLRWVDLGCGQGALMTLAHEMGHRSVTGVDMSEEMLASCRDLGLDVLNGDVSAFLRETPDASCYTVSAFDLLEHFPKEEGYRLLCEIARVLMPGGTLLLKLPNASSPWGHTITASDLTHEASYSPLSLKQLSYLAGFRTCMIREVGPTPRSVVSAIRWFLWRGVRALYRGALLIETGDPGQGVYTQVMLARIDK
jgi:2-polyprenyl-3-methyl-5-hydroxy-6-metoxy-1,4-benzoquinol methylase